MYVQICLDGMQNEIANVSSVNSFNSLCVVYGCIMLLFVSCCVGISKNFIFVSCYVNISKAIYSASHCCRVQYGIYCPRAPLCVATRGELVSHLCRELMVPHMSRYSSKQHSLQHKKSTCMPVTVSYAM